MLTTILLGSHLVTGASSVKDVTGKLESIGNPYKKKYRDGEHAYARNIWDMQTYKGRLYIGAGNSSNLGPARNAGPVPVYVLDPKTDKLINAYQVNDEQIDVFYVFDDQLYIPGHDPKESWQLGNFYRLEKDGKWLKHRTIPEGIHNYAMVWDGHRLYAGLGAQRGAAVAISDDKGETWRLARVADARIYSMFILGNKVYASGRILYHKGMARIFEYDGKDSFIPSQGILFKDIFPQTALDTKYAVAKMVKPINVGRQLVYIGATCHNDHQFMPFGVYVAESLKEARKLNLPHANTRPWDILNRDGVTFILLDTPMKDGTRVSVLMSEDLSNWRELFEFKSPTFARSFELLEGDFYFGLGCEIQDAKKWAQEELKPETGFILRLRK